MSVVARSSSGHVTVRASKRWSTLFFFLFLEGLTHWSLTGSTVTDEDTLMGFSDGLSRSGTRRLA